MGLCSVGRWSAVLIKPQYFIAVSFFIGKDLNDQLILLHHHQIYQGRILFLYICSCFVKMIIIMEHYFCCCCCCFCLLFLRFFFLIIILSLVLACLRFILLRFILLYASYVFFVNCKLSHNVQITRASTRKLMLCKCKLPPFSCILIMSHL